MKRTPESDWRMWLSLGVVLFELSLGECLSYALAKYRAEPLVLSGDALAKIDIIAAELIST